MRLLPLNNLLVIALVLNMLASEVSELYGMWKMTHVSVPGLLACTPVSVPRVPGSDPSAALTVTLLRGLSFFSVYVYCNSLFQGPI